MTAPVAFAMFDREQQDGTPRTDPIAALQALRRYAGRITLFCQAGDISVPRDYRSLVVYLEQSVVPVIPPNPDAISARVRLEAGGRTQECQVSAARSYLSQTELTLTFGLGKAGIADRLEIIWPDGERQVLEEIPADQELAVSRTHPDPPSAGS